MTTPLLDYIAAWAANDAGRVAACVAPDGTVTECYGPVYRGRDRIREWADAWLGAGGVVHSWKVTDHFAAGDREAAQWVFDCTVGGVRSTIDGATICLNRSGLVGELREYATTSPLYEWTGSWR